MDRRVNHIVRLELLTSETRHTFLLTGAPVTGTTSGYGTHDIVPNRMTIVAIDGAARMVTLRGATLRRNGTPGVEREARWVSADGWFGIPFWLPAALAEAGFPITVGQKS